MFVIVSGSSGAGEKRFRFLRAMLRGLHTAYFQSIPVGRPGPGVCCLLFSLIQSPCAKSTEVVRVVIRFF